MLHGILVLGIVGWRWRGPRREAPVHISRRVAALYFFQFVTTGVEHDLRKKRLYVFGFVSCGAGGLLDVGGRRKESREAGQGKGGRQGRSVRGAGRAATELAVYIRKVAPLFFQGDAETKAKARQAILTAAEKILAANPDKAELTLAVDAKMHLLTNEEQLAIFADQLGKAGHEKFARQVRCFAFRMELGKAEKAGPDKLKQAIEKVVALLEATPPGVPERDLVDFLMLVSSPELTNDNQFAFDTYHRLAKVFAASKESALKGVARRLALPERQMKIEGKLPDGKKFDWSKYAGKVVLVDFWATWCVPCVAEIPNMRKCYDLYHDKGFEIVGLSRDRQPKDLKHFLKQKKLPWTIVYGNGEPSPTGDYYGITMIPTMILLGRDGKAVSLTPAANGSARN